MITIKITLKITPVARALFWQKTSMILLLKNGKSICSAAVIMITRQYNARQDRIHVWHTAEKSCLYAVLLPLR